jgi:flagellar biosynthesis/type III secretory pathway M-ring protein FliF/YscJ
VDVLVSVIVVMLVAALVVWFLVTPLTGKQLAAQDERDEARRADLEAARESKYREIRDAELDFRTGKLSEADWRVVDRQLRAEAMGILHALDELGHPPEPR